MRKLALGKLLWRPYDFYSATLAEVFDALQGFVEMEEHRTELTIVQTRRIIAWLVNIQLNKEDRIEERDIWPLPSEIKKQQSLPLAEVIFT